MGESMRLLDSGTRGVVEKMHNVYGVVLSLSSCDILEMTLWGLAARGNTRSRGYIQLQTESKSPRRVG